MTLAAPAGRVVSLIASATETVCALDCGDRLVGRSHECDHPDWVRQLPVCTSPKFDVDGLSYEIDERVKAILQEGLSVYRVDGELLRRLDPDVVVTQSQCEVCAVSLDDVEAALRGWVDADVDVVDLRPEELVDIWGDILKVAAALGVEERGQGLVAELQGRVTAIAETAARVRTLPRVAWVEWIDPLMAGGNWMPELVELAGGRNLLRTAGAHSDTLEWQELLDADPEVIVIAPCGFDIERTRRDLHLLEQRPGWDELRAVQRGRVYVADGLEYFNRPGPRIVESLEILAEILHPERFRFGHQDSGWQAL